MKTSTRPWGLHNTKHHDNLNNLIPEAPPRDAQHQNPLASVLAIITFYFQDSSALAKYPITPTNIHTYTLSSAHTYSFSITHTNTLFTRIKPITNVCLARDLKSNSSHVTNRSIIRSEYATHSLPHLLGHTHRCPVRHPQVLVVNLSSSTVAPMTLECAKYITTHFQYFY